MSQMPVIKEYAQKTCGFLKDMPVIGKFFKRGPRIAVIRLSGIIADSSKTKQNICYRKYYPLIEKAFSKANTAVAVIINSPGGSAAQSSLVAGRIRAKAEETGLPVYAFVEDVAASGGYWLACAADEIYAQEVSIVGSIGVIAASFGFQDLIARYGVERRVHTAGKVKSFLDPFQPEKEEDVKRLKDIQNEIHDAFIAWVKERRGDKLSGNDNELFQGQFWTGPTARDHGIIDGFAEWDSFLKEIYGDDAHFITLAPEKRLLPSLLPFTSLADDLAETLEARSLWSRYGL